MVCLLLCWLWRGKDCVGDEYYTPHGITAEDVVMTSFAFVIEQDTERQTEGLLLMTQFPINYFTVAELDQRFPNFRDHFQKWTGKALTGIFLSSSIYVRSMIGLK